MQYAVHPFITISDKAILCCTICGALYLYEEYEYLCKYKSRKTIYTSIHINRYNIDIIEQSINFNSGL